MKYLADTNIFIVWLENELANWPKLRAIVQNPENQIFLSSVVVWEIAIKKSLGKLKIKENYYTILLEQHFTPLPISLTHAHSVLDLPPHHKDPFDRLLIAQAIAENLPIITHDEHFAQYNIRILQ